MGVLCMGDGLGAAGNVHIHIDVQKIKLTFCVGGKVGWNWLGKTECIPCTSSKSEYIPVYMANIGISLAWDIHGMYPGAGCS